MEEQKGRRKGGGLEKVMTGSLSAVIILSEGMCMNMNSPQSLLRQF